MKLETLILQNDLQTALDPVVFAERGLGIMPDNWQSQALRYRGKRLILNYARQSGKYHSPHPF